jgi:hypothetical protein
MENPKYEWLTIIDLFGIKTNIDTIIKYCDKITILSLEESSVVENSTNLLPLDVQILSKLDLQEGQLELSDDDCLKDFVVKINNIDLHDISPTVDIVSMLESLFVNDVVSKIKNEMSIGDVLCIKRIVTSMEMSRNLYNDCCNEYIDFKFISNYHIKSKI